MKKIRTGTSVLVITGKDRGKIGIVKKIIKDTAVVSGCNKVRKHHKPIPHKNMMGGIVDIEKPIHLSNLKAIATNN